MSNYVVRRAGCVAALGALALVGAAPRAAGQGSGPATKIDAAWLRVDAQAQQLEFDLIAGYNGVNGALNFNGYADGDLTLVVPLGWRVVMPFSNRDGVLPHSAQIIDDVDPVPLGPVQTSFPRAYTRSLEAGLAAGRTDVMRFTADRAGRFLIFCAVPGHGRAGMWIRMDVVAGLKAPEMRHTPTKPG